MGAQTIKRDTLRFTKRTRQLLKNHTPATVSIVQNISTGEVLSVGVTASAAVEHLPADTPQGTWEAKDHVIWR